MSNGPIHDSQAKVATVQDQALATQANQDISPHPHQNVNTMTSRLRDFSLTNPPTFDWFKVDEDPQEFPDEIYKILCAMGVSSSKKAELATYQLNDVAKTCYVQWRDNRKLRGGPVTWENFKVALLYQFFYREMREEKVTMIISKKDTVSMCTLCNSLCCPNILLFWSLILETK